MIVSMTGFSSRILTLVRPVADGKQAELHLSITLKTLNSRFFELNCKLPYSLAFLETQLIPYFKSKLHRGTIQFTIHMSDPSALTGIIQPAFATVRGYINALEKIKEQFGVKGDLHVGDLIALPNIFDTQETPLDERTINQIVAAIYEITEKCHEARIKEGLSLENDLMRRIEVIGTSMQQLEPRSAVVIEQKKQHLFATLETARTSAHQEAASDTLTTLIFNQLERMDIHEEIVRFKSHLTNLTSIIASNEIESGKKIDFTLQELFRETNTIASKCADSQISSLAINIKVELEKAREQAQNIV
jgi:uncharacterized protein (TIGR00255 family)